MAKINVFKITYVRGFADRAQNMIGPVQWEWLKPHVQRDVVVVVNSDLDLVDVGVAIATDNTQAVARWITEQLIGKPTAAQLTLWNSSNQRFTSLIVQPYVLVQDLLVQGPLPTDAPG